MIASLLTAVLPLLLAATAATGEIRFTPPVPVVPTVRLDADTVRADGTGAWNIPLTLHNPGEMGFYTDSLFVEVTDMDPGISRAPRQATVSLGFYAKRAGTVGAGEAKPLKFTLPATSERARLELRLYGHGAGASYAFRETLYARPGALAEAMPSAFLVVKGRRVEIVTAVTPAEGPVPGVLLVPAETSHARRLARTASQFAAFGMNVVVVSPPGYGQSDGPADMAGPATVAALEAALAKLAALPGTNPRRLAAWGTGRGATAALLLAAKHPEIARVIAQDADYDLWASWRAADPVTAAGIRAEAGPDSAGWKARSPLLAARRLGAAVLVMQGGTPGVPAGPAAAFVAARKAAGAVVDTVWAIPGTHQLRKDPQRAGIDFLEAPPGR